MGDDVKIFVTYHNAVTIPKTDCLIPINSTIQTGENIADKESYCELRTQYWVWKNVKAKKNDYVGFFHYRRYLDFSKSKVKRKKPYYITKEPNLSHYTQDYILSEIKNFDIVAPIGEYTGLSVRQRYARSENHSVEHLDTVLEIIKLKFPEYVSSAERYLSGKVEYFGNMYVMRRKIFEGYSEWLFVILNEFDRRVRTVPQKTNGYLGERLFGIWYSYQLEQKKYRCKEVPRVFFSIFDDQEHHFKLKKLVNFFLPAGSKLRGRIVKYGYKSKEKL